MIEDNKVWKHFSGYKNIEAKCDSVVVLLYEQNDGWRYLDHAIYFNGKWYSSKYIPEKAVIGYYEVKTDSFIRCRNRTSEPLKSIPLDFRGEAAVLWEFGRDTDSGYEKIVEDAFKIAEVIDGKVRYVIEHFGMQGPRYVVGYHILPDRMFAKFDDGTIRKMVYNPYRLHDASKQDSTLIIEIKRCEKKSFKVVITKDGCRKTYPIDSPELVEYQQAIQMQFKLMKFTNAAVSKIKIKH